MDEKTSTRVDNGKKELVAPSGIVAYRQTEDIVDDARLIIESAQKWAYRAVNVALVYRNWFLGKRIAEEELKGEDRAKYGAQVIKSLSAVLTEEFGKGFGKQELYKYAQFYKRFPQIVDSLSRQSAPFTILDALSRFNSRRRPQGSWSGTCGSGFPKLERCAPSIAISARSITIGFFPPDRTGPYREKWRKGRQRANRHIPQNRVHQSPYIGRVSRFSLRRRAPMSQVGRRSLPICSNSCLSWAKPMRLWATSSITCGD